MEYSSCMQVLAQGQHRKACVTYLAGGVNDVALVFDAIEVDALGEGVLDGGIVRVDKLVLDELDDQRGFP